MATEHLEVERKYDVDAEQAVPDLTGVVTGVVVGARQEQALVATYLDTDDLRLRAARTTLRHRTGGSDAGWHLKLPAGIGRREIQSSAAPPPAGVPDELLQLIRSVLRRAPLAPVAELRTTRTVHPVQDGTGRILLELVDDRVEGIPVGGEPVRWREWEAELVAGDEVLLDAVEQRLLAAGAQVATSSSKLARVLASRPSAARPVEVDKRSTATDAVQAHLAEHVHELVQRDPDVRRDQPDAVHKMRVATRRLRSALSTFRPMLDREVTDPLREELRWLAGVLGQARDAEVLRDRLLALVDEEPPELVLGPVRKKVDDLLHRRYRHALAAVHDELDGDRYLDLLDALTAVVDAPPWLPAADGRAQDVLPDFVARADRKLRRAVRAAEAEGAPDAALHEVRKLAKRLRYACEAVQPALGRPAKRLAAAATELQEVLGDHQDSVVARGVLRELAAASSRSGQNGFTFGRLHALEELRGQARLALWREAWQTASKPSLRRWL